MKYILEDMRLAGGFWKLYLQNYSESCTQIGQMERPKKSMVFRIILFTE